jgi:hypothetical protein
MARGIDTLLCINKDGNERVLRKNRGPITSWEKPIWVSNIMLEDIPDFSEITDVHESIMSMSGQGRAVCVPVRWLSSNGSIVKVNEMYPELNEIKVVFLKNRNAMRLVLISAKTKEEILAAGADSDGKYRFPLLLSVTHKKYEQVNLF